MENNLKNRLHEFIASKGMSVRRFELACGMPNACVSNMHNNITSRRLQAIMERFPELDLQWLLTGEGEMLRTGANTVERADGMYAKLIRVMEEFVKQETKNAECYRECIDRLQEQNLKLMGMLERFVSGSEPECSNVHDKI